ncbi:ribokinase [Cohnella sp. LGH]|uniref:ribokinase n=1 Tax=Cohnella sp. LGH TaxID=1619153 RepID=UPI001ADC0B98|nr:ribokinase [Cohnella sp. LGH]QTH40371.1 ribokinase [Cohnella sp. LGH]
MEAITVTVEPLSRKVVVFGSLNIDIVVSVDRLPQAGETVTARGSRLLPGGKGANQAVALARLGADAVLVGAVGDDEFGVRLVEAARQEGLSAEAIRIVPSTPSGTAMIYHAPSDNCIAVVPGANACWEAELVASCGEMIAGGTIVLAQLELPWQAVARAFELARQHGVRTVLNPAPAPASGIPESLLRLTDILTPNESEFRALCGRDCDTDELLEAALLEWEAAYGHRVLVTRGAIGASYLEAGHLRTVPSLAVEVADTTGAGDTFNGALCFGLANGWPFDRAAHFAAAAASLSVTQLGAQAGMPTFEAVMRRLPAES